MITVLLQLLGLLYAFVLPGTLVALHVEADWSWPVRLAVGFTVGLLTIPMASFCAAWVLATSVTPAVVVGVATVANALAGGLLWLRRRHGRERRRSAARRPASPPGSVPE